MLSTYFIPKESVDNEGDADVETEAAAASALTGYYTPPDEDGNDAGTGGGSGGVAAVAGQSPNTAEAVAAAAAAAHLALEAHQSAFAAESAASMHQERAAHLSERAAAAQSAAFAAVALSGRIGQALFVSRSLESRAVSHANAARRLASEGDQVATLAVRVTNFLTRLDSEQRQVAHNAKAHAAELAHNHDSALNALANARVHANHAANNAENALDFKFLNKVNNKGREEEVVIIDVPDIIDGHHEYHLADSKQKQYLENHNLESEVASRSLTPGVRVRFPRKLNANRRLRHFPHHPRRNLVKLSHKMRHAGGSLIADASNTNEERLDVFKPSQQINPREVLQYYVVGSKDKPSDEGDKEQDVNPPLVYLDTSDGYKSLRPYGGDRNDILDAEIAKESFER